MCQILLPENLRNPNLKKKNEDQSGIRIILELSTFAEDIDG